MSIEREIKDILIKQREVTIFPESSNMFTTLEGLDTQVISLTEDTGTIFYMVFEDNDMGGVFKVLRAAVDKSKWEFL